MAPTPNPNIQLVKTRLPRQLVADLHESAAHNERTLTGELRWALTGYLDKQRFLREQREDRSAA